MIFVQCSRGWGAWALSPRLAAKVYNANRSEEPVRYTKKRLLRNQETKFLPPLAWPFAFLDFV